MSQEYQYNDLNEFIITTLLDDFDDYEYDDEEKGPALEIYGTDITLFSSSGSVGGMFWT